MPHKLVRPDFDSRGEYVVAKTFRLGGRDFRPGEDFPHRRLAVDHRALRRLYVHRWLRFRSEVSTRPAPEALTIEVTPAAQKLLDENDLKAAAVPAKGKKLTISDVRSFLKERRDGT